MKWVLTEDDDLLFIPKYVDGTEIKHTVPTRGAPVRGAAEVEIEVLPGRPPYANTVNRHSDHYEPDLDSLGVGVDRMRKAGIIVDDKNIDTSKYPPPPTHK
ncbi:MAG: hypothetical protein KC731_09450 [Myxococcales bacterium]|nr:hypothetical protein [Myxococcales bacterium]